jgi:hypothetical protein
MMHRCCWCEQDKLQEVPVVFEQPVSKTPAALCYLQCHLQTWLGQQAVGLLSHSSMWSLHMHQVNAAVR